MAAAASKSSWPLAVIAAAGIAFFAACYYPGAMSLDSAVIWSQARGAPSTNIYGAGLRWLWQVTDPVWAGPAPLFLIQLALFWAGLALIARALECGLTGRIAFLLAAAFAPVVFVLLAHVWGDVMLLATLTFAVGALLRWRDGAGTGWLATFWLSLVFAAVLRHNVLCAIVPLVVYGIWLLLKSSAISPARKRVALVLGTLMLSFGLHAVNALSAQCAQRRFTLWPAISMWDLTAMSIDANQMLLPAATRKPELTLDDLRAAYVPYSNVPVFTATQGRVIGPFFLTGDPVKAALHEAWLDAVSDHPAAYFAHRWRLTRALFGVKPRDWPHELVYADDEIAFGSNPPVAANHSVFHAATIRVAEALRDTAVLAPWPYLVLGLAALAVAWRRRAQANAQAAIAVLGSGFAYAAPLPLIAPSAELRYLGWSCLAAVIGAGLALSSAPRQAAEGEAPNC